MILSDAELREYLRSGKLIIDPLGPDTIRENGVDLRVGKGIARLLPASDPLDPVSKPDLARYYRVEDVSEFVVAPGKRVLVTTLERIKMPNDLIAFVELRSTYARLGLSIPPTIIDACFEGTLTIGLSGGAFPVKLREGDRVFHVIFAKLAKPVEKPYAGKYQGQRGITLPKF